MEAKEVRLIDLPRYHVFFGSNQLFCLNERSISVDDKGVTHYYWEYHRVYKDGRTKLQGIVLTHNNLLESIQVLDLGDIYDWMKEHHPNRYKRENWEASRPKEV